jgi:CHAT domain-containing protein/Tfp pilus assembly protein PilF
LQAAAFRTSGRQVKEDRMTRPRLLFGALLAGALAGAPLLRADEAPKAEPKAPDSKPTALPISEIKVRTHAAGRGRAPACLCWSPDAKSFYRVDAAGMVHQIRYPELLPAAANTSMRKCTWITMSAAGLVATVAGADEAWLLDPVTLKETQKIPIGKAQYVVSSPKLAFAYAVETASKAATLTVLDLKTGKAVKLYARSDLGEGAGLDRPVVSADGRHLFAVGGGRLWRYKLNGAEVALVDATEPIMKGRFEGISLSNDGTFVCAPSGGGNIGAGEYSTFVYSTDDLKKPALTIASGRFPLAIGFDVGAGLLYAQNLQTALIVFDFKGNKLREFAQDKDKVGIGPELCQFLVHPKGRQFLYLVNPAVGSQSPAKVFAVELPPKGMGGAAPAIGAVKDRPEAMPPSAPERVQLDDIVKEAAKLFAAKKFKEATPLYEKAALLAPQVQGENDRATASIFTNLATAYSEQGRFTEAGPLLQRSLAINESLFGKEHASVAIACSYLGLNCIELGKYTDAESLLKRALAMREKLLGKEHSLIVTSLQNLGSLHSAQGNHANAEDYFRRAITLAEKVDGAASEELAGSIAKLAVFYAAQGRYADAEPLHQRALGIFEKALGSEHPRVATSLNSLGALHQQLGKDAEAEKLFRRSLSIYQKANGAEHTSVANVLLNLANLREQQRQFAEAQSLYEQSLAIFEKARGKDHPSVAIVLHNLANLYVNTGKLAQAEPLFQRSLDIYQKVHHLEHLSVARIFNDLANLYAKQQKFAEAEKLYRHGLRIEEQILGGAHPLVATSLYNLFLLSCDQKKYEQAAQLQTQLEIGVGQFLLRELPSMSAREQRDFLEKHERRRFALALSLGRARSDDASIVQASAGWLVNGKSIALEAQTIRGRLEREVADPDGQAILREIQAIRAQEANIALKAKQAESAAKQREELESRRRELEKTLARRGGAAGKLAHPWIEMADVRRNIPPDGVLIDIARVPIYEFEPKLGQERWLAPHYIAWVTPALGAGKMHIVDLGPAATIDSAVQEARQALESTVDQLEKGQQERKLEADAAAKLDVVAKRTFERLKGRLGGAKKLIISPDGDLWLLPWAALPTGPGRYLIEDYSLRYVVTARDLVEDGGQNLHPTTAPLILADPDYNLTPAQVAAARPLDLKPDNAIASLTRSAGDDLRGIGRVKRLPGTAAEARQAFEKLKALTGQEPRLYQQAEASETIVKTAKSPRALVLATHGFFLKAKEEELKDDALPGLAPTANVKPPAPKEKNFDNPLLRCGLLLAGANKRAEAKEGEDDGVLTGLEIVGLDLRGTQMVVLSACETGVGEVQTGEGVAGLRQAFQLAGAESVLSTLWQISDRATSDLMNTYYDELGNGADRAEALTQAQRKFLQDRRAKNGAAHPFFWASFTLTGKGGSGAPAIAKGGADGPEQSPLLKPTAPGKAEEVIPADVLARLRAATVLVRANGGAYTKACAGVVAKVHGDQALILADTRVAKPAAKLKLTRPELEIIFNSGRETEFVLPGEVVPFANYRGLAVILVKGPKALPRPLEFGEGVGLDKGSSIFLFGFPAGAGLVPTKDNPAITISKGVVTGLINNKAGEATVINVDGDLHGGNTGGPAVDEKGRIIGVVLAPLSEEPVPAGPAPSRRQPPRPGPVAPAPKPKSAQLGGRVLPAREVAKALEVRQLSLGIASVKPKNDGAEVEVHVQFFDPFEMIDKASLLYREMEPVQKPIPADEGAPVLPLPNAQTIPLERDDLNYKALITLKSDGRMLRHFSFQSSFGKKNEPMHFGAEPFHHPISFRMPFAKDMKPAPEAPLPAKLGRDDIKVRVLEAGTGPFPACLCWSANASSFYQLDSKGTVRRFNYPELLEVAVNPVGRACNWLSLSSEGIIASVPDAQEAWLLDADTLREIRKLPLGKARIVVSSPKLSLGYAVEKSGALTVFDLKTGAPVNQVKDVEFIARGAGGFGHPVVSDDGKFLFGTGGKNGVEVIVRCKLDGNKVAFVEASSNRVILNEFSGLCLSGDGNLVCAPCSGGNPDAGQFATSIYASDNLRKPALTILSGAYPAAVGFDGKASLIYAQNQDHDLIVFDAKGVKQKEFVLAKNRRVKTCQFLVHPVGRQLLVLVNASVGATGPSKIFAVELPNPAQPPPSP